MKELVHSYVLSDFAKAEKPWVETLCEAVADNAGLLARGEDAGFQNEGASCDGCEGFRKRDARRRAGR